MTDYIKDMGIAGVLIVALLLGMYFAQRSVNVPCAVWEDAPPVPEFFDDLPEPAQVRQEEGVWI